jgi:NAD(P)-dependent dehydrogenase (short-subunit alcohol dehydrogenase family)
MNDAPDLRGRTVIVTGASSGIGAATARALHAAGAQPVLAARSPCSMAARSAAFSSAYARSTAS